VAEFVRFFVPGIPAPGGSKKGFVVGKRAVIVDDCKRSKPWMQRVASVAADHFATPLVGPVEVTFSFVVPRPKGHYGSGRNVNTIKPSAPEYPTTKPDTTKFVRSTEDALKGIAWGDDSQVVSQRAVKRYGLRPGVMIEISSLAKGA